MAETTGAPDRVVVRLFAGARAAAGASQAEVDVPHGATVGSVLEALVIGHPGVARVLPACSFLLDGVSARPDHPVGSGRTVDVLPPFSGG